MISLHSSSRTSAAWRTARRRLARRIPARSAPSVLRGASLSRRAARLLQPSCSSHASAPAPPDHCRKNPSQLLCEIEALRAVDVRPVDEKMGRDAAALLAKTRTDDPIDATVVLVARSGDRILTSDPHDIGRLASSSGKSLAIVPC